VRQRIFETGRNEGIGGLATNLDTAVNARGPRNLSWKTASRYGTAVSAGRADVHGGGDAVVEHGLAKNTSCRNSANRKARGSTTCRRPIITASPDSWSGLCRIRWLSCFLRSRHRISDGRAACHRSESAFDNQSRGLLRVHGEAAKDGQQKKTGRSGSRNERGELFTCLHGPGLYDTGRPALGSCRGAHGCYTTVLNSHIFVRFARGDSLVRYQATRRIF